jgi:Flp pilus assembly protein TadG
MRRTDLAGKSVQNGAPHAAAQCAVGPKAWRRGATVVEAAIVMNIFLLLIFGIFEFGHFVMVKQLMDNAARDGARMASTGALTVTTSQIQAQVTSELNGLGPSNLTINVFQANPTTGANIGAWTNAGLGDTVAVQITGNYQPMLSIAALIPNPVAVSSEAMVYSESPD